MYVHDHEPDIGRTKKSTWMRNIEAVLDIFSFYQGALAMTQWDQGITSQEPPPLPRKPPLCLTRSADLVEARFWPAAGGKFWGISGTTKEETLQKVI